MLRSSEQSFKDHFMGSSVKIVKTSSRISYLSAEQYSAKTSTGPSTKTVNKLVLFASRNLSSVDLTNVTNPGEVEVGVVVLLR